MAVGSSPSTSEIASVTLAAGASARASCPPLIRDRCRRTTLISAMVAPLATSWRVTATLSSRVSPAAGLASRAEAPPVSSTMKPSPARGLPTKSKTAAAARALASSGNGCPASSCRHTRSDSAWPCLTITRPSSMRAASTASTPRASEAAALPAPITRRRAPRAASGSNTRHWQSGSSISHSRPSSREQRCSSVSPCTAAMAARQAVTRPARGPDGVSAAGIAASLHPSRRPRTAPIRRPALRRGCRGASSSDAGR